MAELPPDSAAPAPEDDDDIPELEDDDDIPELEPCVGEERAAAAGEIMDVDDDVNSTWQREAGKEVCDEMRVWLQHMQEDGEDSEDAGRSSMIKAIGLLRGWGDDDDEDDADAHTIPMDEIRAVYIEMMRFCEPLDE
jgi:hypothetical protein